MTRATADVLADRLIDGSCGVRIRTSAASSLSASSTASWTNCLMIVSPQGPSA